MVVKKESLFTVVSVSLGLLLFCLILSGKMYYMSMSEFDKGSTLENQGEYYKAIVHYDRALRCFFPYNPYIQRSFNSLLNIGERFEKEGKNKEALVLYENIHGTLLSTRSLFFTNTQELAKCSIKIKKLSTFPASFPKKQFPPPSPPNTILSFLQGVGLLGWIFSAILLIYRRKSNIVQACLVSFFVVWLLGISLA